MKIDYETEANRYKPKSVIILFIAESPPYYESEDKKSYFYFEENPGSDMLFATIANAIFGLKYRKGSRPIKRHILNAFKKKGYWLIDAVEYPINRIDSKVQSDSVRREIIKKEIPNLLARLEKIKENSENMTIILLKNLVHECLFETLSSHGYKVANKKPIGFPRYYYDKKTVEDVRKHVAISRLCIGSRTLGVWQ